MGVWDSGNYMHVANGDGLPIFVHRVSIRTVYSNHEWLM